MFKFAIKGREEQEKKHFRGTQELLVILNDI